jgi:hypothetical protein
VRRSFGRRASRLVLVHGVAVGAVVQADGDPLALVRFDGWRLTARLRPRCGRPRVARSAPGPAVAGALDQSGLLHPLEMDLYAVWMKVETVSGTVDAPFAIPPDSARRSDPGRRPLWVQEHQRDRGRGRPGGCGARPNRNRRGVVVARELLVRRQLALKLAACVVERLVDGAQASNEGASRGRLL